ncbi:MAG: hypothetical protein M2R45_00130 [Verrucomicrobia subdivision 3 bacterium]|nr:hypothetical protein [Limisphaerales bacterium]MCS1412410.1 hypothetical protein [Limisphaerales bacterium]
MLAEKRRSRHGSGLRHLDIDQVDDKVDMPFSRVATFLVQLQIFRRLREVRGHIHSLTMPEMKRSVNVRYSSKALQLESGAESQAFVEVCQGDENTLEVDRALTRR